MTIEISPELERYVQQQIKISRFASVNEVFEAGLRQMMHDETFDEADSAALDEAEQEIDAGSLLDWKKVSTELRREFLGE